MNLSTARAVAAIVMVLGAGMFPAAAQEPAKPLKFGTALGYPPFEYLDETGKMAGFDIEIGNAICEQLKRECEWINIDFSAMVPALKARKFDAMLASVAVTEDRKKQLDFTAEVYRGGARLVARKSSGITMDLATLKGKRIGVEQGTTEERFVKARWVPAGVELVPYATQDSVYADLGAGRLDGACIAAIQAQLGFLNEARGADFAFVSDDIKDPLVGDGVTAIAVDKGNTEILKTLNTALAAIHADGTFDRIAAKYFPSSLKVYSE